ncbi:chorismate mutase [Tsuneonella sp. HG249]
MLEAHKNPAQCETMTEVRAGVDATDRELITLLERRFGYMRAAARIKPDRSSVRDEARKAQVIAAAVAEAQTRGLPPAAIEQLWDRLVEASIAYEFDEWDRMHQPARSPLSAG